ncbi:hypothetical protein PBRA_003137 [Plasmodiophora brassicae]|uniref:NAA35-like N-terminal domain-containing protein n=1 Tax=Plasmodiophora brassicae TaxID=37360 RepID=A0A0G4J774_PLABS|nr:hypothetical protein PBRA_003137 [Plasmodiophora brassicae]
MQVGDDNEPEWLPRSTVDLTDDFRKATQSLDVGEMIHGPRFSLFDSMSAIELFDEKMDPRLKYRPVEGPDPNIGFEWTSAEHAIACIDRMLQCEVLVHNGASLIHSLFLCRWLHSPSLLLQSSMESPWTRCVIAYSIAVLRCVARALDAIYLADAVYEEDAILDRFGFDLGDKVSSGYIIGLLDTALAVPAPNELRARLLHRRSFLIAMEYLSDQSPTSALASLELASEFFQQTVDAAAELDRDRDLSRLLTWFDPAVPAQFIASCPPRPVTFPSLSDCIGTHSEITSQLQSLSAFASSSNSLGDLVEFYSTLHGSRQVGTVARSCAFLLLRGIGPLHVLAQRNGMSSSFANCSAAAIADWLRCLSLTRSRAHRYTSKLLTTWHILQEQVRRLPPHQPSLTIIRDQLILIVARHLELNLELDLLMSTERPGAFFVLSTVLSELSERSDFVQGCFDMASGLYLAFNVFNRFRPSSLSMASPYTQAKTVFEKRYEAVFRALPDLLSWNALCDRNAELDKMDIGEVAAQSADRFRSARARFSSASAASKLASQNARARALAEIAIGNAVAVLSAERQCDKHAGHASLSVSFERDHTYPVVALSSSKPMPSS